MTNSTRRQAARQVQTAGSNTRLPPVASMPRFYAPRTPENPPFSRLQLDQADTAGLRPLVLLDHIDRDSLSLDERR